MEEIQAKYLIKKFKERTSKQRSLKFEEIDLDLYRAAAKCASFITSEERILHWVKTFQYRYYETLKDSGDFLIKWIDHEGHESANFKEIEIKISTFYHGSTTASSHGDKNPEEHSHLMITIHIYLTTGIIMFQGSAYKFWSEKEFPVLKEITEFSATQPTPLVTDSDAANESVPVDKELLDNLSELLASLPPKKSKKPAKNSSSVCANDDTQPNECLPKAKASYETPLNNRKRRNSFDSMRGLSARKNATISELKHVVSNLESDITEINKILQSQPEINLS